MVRLVQAPSRLGRAPARIRNAAKVALPFYQSAPWRGLVARLIALRGRRCEDCGAADKRIFGDHVIELRDGGASLDPGNVRLLCGKCHGVKTERRKRERAGLA